MLIYIRGVYAAPGIKIPTELLPVLLRAGRVRNPGQHSPRTGPWTSPSAARAVRGCHRLCCHPELFLHLPPASGLCCWTWGMRMDWTLVSSVLAEQHAGNLPCSLPVVVRASPSRHWAESLWGRQDVNLWDAPLPCSLIQCSSAPWPLVHSHERWCHSYFSWFWYHILGSFKLVGQELRGDFVWMWISVSSD